jgi:hypothetical protein
MAPSLKLLLGSHAPGVVTVAAWQIRRTVFPSEAQEFERRVFRQLGDPHEVLRGPFRGMHYVRLCYGGSTLNRTLGTYELEVHPCIEQIIASDPDLVIDVGTSDGYYLVGLARRLPRARAIGFDALPVCRTLTRRVAHLNGMLDRVEVHGFCTAERLQRALQKGRHPAVVCDCDSGEMQVMDPVAAPMLRQSIILLEVHDDIQPGISQEMRRRFAQTHQITEIPQQLRHSTDVPAPYGVSAADALRIADERRPTGNFWLFLTPMASVSAAKPSSTRE